MNRPCSFGETVTEDLILGAVVREVERVKLDAARRQLRDHDPRVEAAAQKRERRRSPPSRRAIALANASCTRRPATSSGARSSATR